MKIIRSAAFLGITLLLLPGCGEKDRRGSTALDAAIVPGADLAGEVEYSLLRKAPVFEILRGIRHDRDPLRAREDEERAVKLEETAGLGREDLQSLVFSADLDSADLSAAERGGEYRKLRAVLAASFRVNVTPAQVEAVLQAIAAENPGSVVKRERIEEREVFTVAEGPEALPFIFVALSSGGDTVFATLNADGMSEVFARESSGSAEKVPAAVTAYEAYLPEGSQFRTSVILPEGLRRTIGEKTEEWQQQASRNPGVGLILSFIAPFRKLAGFSVGTRFDEGLDIGMAADLAGEAEALQAGAILQTMLLPLLKARIARSSLVDPQSLEEKMRVSASGSVVSASLKLQESDLKALNQQTLRGASGPQ